jgi:hypothetical protein
MAENAKCPQIIDQAKEGIFGHEGPFFHVGPRGSRGRYGIKTEQVPQKPLSLPRPVDILLISIYLKSR